MITLQDIRKVFNAGKPNEFVAIEDVNLAIDSDRATALKGPSGSGKTTLLSISGVHGQTDLGQNHPQREGDHQPS